MKDPETIIATGRQKVLELCLDALTCIQDIMAGGAPQHQLAAAKLALEMALKGPFELRAPPDDLEGQRLENRAREAIAEVLQIAAPMGDENAD